MSITNWLTVAMACLVTVGVAGCSDKVAVTGSGEKDATWSGTQSETASDSSFSGGRPIFVVTYNDCPSSEFLGQGAA